MLHVRVQGKGCQRNQEVSLLACGLTAAVVTGQRGQVAPFASHVSSRNPKHAFAVRSNPPYQRGQSEQACERGAWTLAGERMQGRVEGRWGDGQIARETNHSMQARAGLRMRISSTSKPCVCPSAEPDRTLSTNPQPTKAGHTDEKYVTANAPNPKQRAARCPRMRSITMKQAGETEEVVASWALRAQPTGLEQRTFDRRFNPLQSPHHIAPDTWHTAADLLEDRQSPPTNRCQRCQTARPIQPSRLPLT